jgi:hypothetical protein
MSERRMPPIVVKRESRFASRTVCEAMEEVKGHQRAKVDGGGGGGGSVAGGSFGS